MKIIKTPVSLSAGEKEQWLHRLKAFGDPEKIFFMDIETTGFSRMYDSVYLTGFLYYEHGRFCIEQHLASGISDEWALVSAYCERLVDADVLITFNGEMFDLPFMENRRRLLHVEEPIPALQSVDLYRNYRPLQKVFGWENCKLKTIERFLGIDREDPFDGGQLISVYEEYAISQDEALEKVLLLHNFEDILNMPRLLRLDAWLDYMRGGQVVEIHCTEDEETVRITASMQEQAPLSFSGTVPVSKTCPQEIAFSTEAGSTELNLLLPKQKGVCYHYLPNPADYYYLPERDAIVHKSFADSLGPVKKVKATSKNCRIAKDGTYLTVQAAPEGVHIFTPKDMPPGKKGTPVLLDLEELGQRLKDADTAWKTAFLHHIFTI